jgi:hypothetical protein
MINGRTVLIAHLGNPTKVCKSPMIYKPWFLMRPPSANIRRNPKWHNSIHWRT